MLDFLNHAGQWLMVVLLVGAPVGLAWWLSDGFAGFLDWPSGGLRVGHGINPHTGKAGLVIRHGESGVPTAYID